MSFVNAFVLFSELIDGDMDVAWRFQIKDEQMTQKSRPTNRKSTSRRRILAMQLLSLMASSTVTNSIEAAIRTQAPPTAGTPTVVPPKEATPAEVKNSDTEETMPSTHGDEFLDDAPTDGEAMPNVADDASSLLDQSITPFELPDSDGLDAPTFNLATGLASSLGATRDSYSSAPAMMGDFFGGSFLFGSDDALTVALAGGDRRYKIAENVSPVPQNRVYFNYNHFHNALTDLNLQEYSLERFAFGGERAFSDGLFSIDIRLPFSSALNSTYDFDNPSPQATELGNLGFGLKTLLLTGDTWVVSGGTTLVLPTGDDFRLRSGGVDTLVIKNEAVHMAPYLGFLGTPNQKWFLQGFIQTDFDLNGNEIIQDGTSQGLIQDQNLLFVDMSMGRWISKRRLATGRTLGIAALSELHYTTTINDPDFVGGFGNPFENMDILNATLGMHIQYGRAALRIGGAAPLRDDEEKLFDSEVFVQVSRAI